MLALAAVCENLCSVLIVLFCDSDRVCRVEPVFRLYFVVYLVGMTVLMVLYSLAASSASITTGVKPVKVQRASLDVVRKSLAIFIFIRRCTLL